MPKYRKYQDGFQILNENYEGVSLPVSSGVAIAKGDVLIMASGYLTLATTLGIATAAPSLYIALSENTAAEASSSGAINCQCVPMLDTNVRYQVPVTANTVLVQATHVGNAYDLDGSEDGITLAAAVTVDWGFMIEEIDISTEAIAAETYGYAIGRFCFFSETS